jgi:hypothetical protein
MWKAILALSAVIRMPAAIKPIILNGDWLISKTPSLSALGIRPPQAVSMDSAAIVSASASASWRRR